MLTARVIVLALAVISKLACTVPETMPVLKPNSQFQAHVLVFLSGDITRPVNLSVLQGIREVLNQRGGESIQIHTETFLQTPGYQAQMRAICKERYASVPIRAIITVNAMVSAANAVRAEFWPGIPMVYLSSGISPPASAPNSAVVNRDLDTNGTLLVAHRLFPKAKRLILVGGSSPADRVRCQLIIRMTKEAVPQWQIVDLSGLTAAQMKDKVAATPPDSVIMLTGMSMDGAGQQVTSPQVINLLSPVARAPMFDVIDSGFSLGIVGGALAQNREAGHELGNILLRVLSGEEAKKISPVWLHSRVLLDWRQLKRFGIRESQIPAEAEVRFRDASLWQAYGRWLMGGLLAVLVQGALILFLIGERRSRRASEIELSERLRYELIVSEITANFARVSSGGRAEQLDHSLQRLTEFLGAERTSLWRYIAETGEFARFRSWMGTSPDVGVLTYLQVPEIVQQFKAGKVVRIEQAALLPESSEIRRIFNQLGVKSSVGIPLQTGGRLVGALTCSTFAYHRSWPDSVMQRLKTLGELFTSELALMDSEDAAQASEELNRAVLASLPGHRVIVDRNGIVIKTSDELTFGTGTSFRCSTLGENFLDYCRFKATSVPGMNQVANALNATLSGLATQTTIEVSLALDGAQHWFEIRVQALVGAQGGAVISQVDVSARKRAEIQAAQNLEYISHLNRVGALNELASSLAHELNQPLAAISANAESVMMMVNMPQVPLSELKDTVDDIISDNMRAGEVIRGMREMLKKRHPSSVNTDLNEAATNVQPLVRNEALLRKIELCLDLSPNIPPVMADPVQLQQVILNLVVNGMDAMMDVPEASRVLTVRSRSREGFVELEVEDSGKGIPAESLQTIFESFYTTKPNGLGIGLSICRSIVESGGGRIWAENGPKGAVFRLALPVAAPENPQDVEPAVRAVGR